MNWGPPSAHFEPLRFASLQRHQQERRQQHSLLFTSTFPHSSLGSYEILFGSL